MRKFRPLYCLWIVAFLAFLESVSDGKPNVREILPRSVQIGSRTELTVAGDFSVWPVKVWVDRPGLEIEIGKKGKLTATTTAQTKPGVYLLNLRERTGVSSIVPLVVDSIPSAIEKEPNQRPSEATRLSGPTNVSGALGKSGDVDCFSIQCKKGQALFAGMRANPLFGKTMDGVIQVCDSQGFVLDQNDDRIGIDPSISVTIPKDGLYLVRVFAFPATPNSSVRFAGGADYRYLLTISNGPVLEFGYPVTDKALDKRMVAIGSGVPDQLVVEQLDSSCGFNRIGYSPKAAGFFEFEKSHAKSKAISESEDYPETGLEVPFDLTGLISVPRELDWIPVQCEKAKKIRFSIEARCFGLEMDPSVAIFNSLGKQLVVKDDNSKSDPDLVFEFSPPSDGVYFLRIKDAADAGGEKYFYRCRAENVEPGFRLTVKNHAFEMAPNKPLELEVSIERLNGFKEPIDFDMTGLPPNTVFKNVQSKVKEKSEKSVKLIVESKEEFQSRIQIVGESAGKKVFAEFETGLGRKTRDFWITALKSEKSK